MKRFSAIFLLLFVAASWNSCKKDNLDSGPFAITPHDFLSDKDYSKLVVEVAYVDGYRPSNESVNEMVSFLDARLNKSRGISVSYTSFSSPGKSSYTLDDIRQIEKDHRSNHTKGSTLTAFVVFVDAPFAGNSGNNQVVGTAYGTTSIVVFERTVNDNSGGIGQPSKYVLESTVSEHEFGHLFGLVDNGTAMVTPHRDVANGFHCDNHNCLMYYAVESTDILGMLGTGGVPQLDANCLADLRANGGK